MSHHLSIYFSFISIHLFFKKKSKFFRKTLDFMMIIVYNIQALSGCSADGSVLGSGPRGRGFKSRHSDHLLKVLFINESVDK